MKSIRKHEVADGWKWFQQAWDDTEGARVDFFVVGLIIFALMAVISRLPLLGGVAASFVFPLFHYGAYLFSAAWRERKDRQISLVFVPFQDRALFKNLLPLCWVSVGFGAVSLLLKTAFMGGFGFLFASAVVMILLHAVQGAVLYFAPPLVAIDGMEPRDAMKLSIRAVMDNLPVMVIAGLLGFLLFLIGVATLGIGLIFLLPVYTYLPYLVFHAVLKK